VVGDKKMNTMNRQIPFFLLVSFLLPASGADAQKPGPTEYQVKAAFLYNFAKFVEWPPAVGALQVCIFGDDHFGGDAEAIEGKMAGGKALVIKRTRSVQDIGNCGMLFISSSESERLGGIIAAVRKADILTVGDTPGYAERGVIINFYMEHGKVRFEINREAAERSRLKISSKLFGLARIVRNTGRYTGR